MLLLEKVGGISRVTHAWEGQTVVCFASGPSLTQEQVAAVRSTGLRAIAVNDCYLIAPWADVVYFADPKFFNWQIQGQPKPVLGLSAEDVKRKWSEFAGEKCSITSSVSAIPDPAVHVLKNAGPGDNNCGLSKDPTAIVTGSHSGYQALNIAVLSGAKRIILLGYDCKRGADGKRHWFGDHPDRSEPPYKAIVERFGYAEKETRKLGIEVINCSPDSAITAFEKIDLASALARDASIQSDTTAAVVSG